MQYKIGDIITFEDGSMGIVTRVDPPNLLYIVVRLTDASAFEPVEWLVWADNGLVVGRSKTTEAKHVQHHRF